MFGGDRTLAVATLHLGWSLVEAVKRVPGLRYAAAAQGTWRFWRQAEAHDERLELVRRLKQKSQL